MSAAVTYVNTNAGDSLAYPYVLRVTFAEPNSILIPDAVASAQLANDIGNLTDSMASGGYAVAMASDPTVAPGALAVTIDFAPLDPNASPSVASILAQLTAGLTGVFDFLQSTYIARVEKVDSSSAQGTQGGVARGQDSTTVETARTADSFGNQLTGFLGTTERVVVVVGIVAATVYFWPEIAAMFGAGKAYAKRHLAKRSAA